MTTTLKDLVFAGLNSRVAALDSNTGDIIWDWTAPKPWKRGYVSLLLPNETHLFVSVNGYTYCLDPLNGKQLWFNELKGFGEGVTSLAALNQYNPQDVLLAVAAAAEAEAASGGGGD